MLLLDGDCDVGVIVSGASLGVRFSEGDTAIDEDRQSSAERHRPSGAGQEKGQINIVTNQQKKKSDTKQRSCYTGKDAEQRTRLVVFVA